MIRVPLTRGKFALIDDEDFCIVSKHKWSAYYDKVRDVYKAFRHGSGHTIYLHRVIMKCPTGMVVDHINHDTLDNRRQNLRICTPAQNRYNLKLRRISKYGFKGVSFKNKRWEVQVKIHGKYIYAGRYSDLIEAAKAYDKKAKELFGEFAYLNFP